MTKLTVNECSIIPTQVKTNQCTCCDVIPRAFRHARTYPVATQKGVADFMFISITIITDARANACVYPVLRLSHFIAIDTYK